MKRGAKSDGVNIIGAKVVGGDESCDAPLPPPPVVPEETVIPEEVAPVDEDPNEFFDTANFDDDKSTLKEPIMTPADIQQSLTLSGEPESIPLPTGSQFSIKSVTPEVVNWNQFFQIEADSLVVLIPKLNFFRKTCLLKPLTTKRCLLNI